MPIAGRRPRVAMLPDLTAERLDLADLLDTLDEEEWAVPSLCPAGRCGTWSPIW